MTSIADHRRFYAEYIVRSAGSGDQRLIEAFAAVPREDFVGPGPWQVFVGSGYLPTLSDDPRLLYQDVLVALAPERQINNGQPSLHARCLAAVAPAAGETVVHLGAGSGYYSAILAELVGSAGRVIAIEREADLAERARAALQRWPQAEVRHASATDAALPASDVIYVSAGATHPPAAWLDALRVGGRLVFPLTPHEGFGVMLLVTRRSDASYAAAALMRVAFIPCIGARDDAASASLAKALQRQSLQDVRSLVRSATPDGSAWCSGDGWWLSSAEA
ncbi:MAG: protein-L-isoaspartate(D-aspartate) O-methyltransferase [Proteobacteria bacterium]|nr:protein-L-isoaspartate(D-aspartate) O-methyltransferase [Pseudomonadota bacterium]